MKFASSLLIFFLLPYFITAQEKEVVDSLLSLYNTQAHDTTKILVLNKIAEQYYRSSPDTAITLAENALTWSERIFYDQGKAVAYNVIGLGYWIKTNNVEALTNFKKSLFFSEKCDDKQNLAWSLNNIGLIYYYQNDYTMSLEYYQRALKINEEFNYKEGTALVLNNIGLNYEFQGNLKLALDYYQNALRIYKEAGIKIGIGQSLTNIGYVYFNQGNYNLALINQQKAAIIQEQVNDRSTLISTLLCISEIYQRQKQYDQSIAYGQRALQIAIKVKSPFDVKEAAHVLYKTYKDQNNFARSLAYFEQYKEMNDSIFNIENNKAISSLEARLTLEKKLKEIEVLEKASAFQQRINYLVIAGLLIVGTLAFFILKNRKKLQQAYNKLEVTNSKLLEVKKEVEVQAEILRKSNRTKDKMFSIVSHDLRSPLSALKGLLTLLENKNLTLDELKSFVPDLGKRVSHASDIVEELLHWSRSQMDAMEINPVEIDLNEVLEKKIIRFRQSAIDKGVDIRLNLASAGYKVRADLDMLKTILRNLMTNAIKFCKRGNTITLITTVEGDFVKVCVADTGVGIKPEDYPKIFNEQGFTTYGTANEKGTGLGLMLCKEFVEKNGGKIWVESEWGNGTKFCFTLLIVKQLDIGLTIFRT